MIRAHVAPERINPVGPDDFLERSDPANIDRYDYHFSHDPLCCADELARRPFRFTFLRDPVDRVISAYNHILRDPLHWRHAPIVSERLAPEDLFEHPEVLGDFRHTSLKLLGMRPDFTSMRGDWSAMRVQVNAELHHPGFDAAMVERAFRNLEQLDFVGVTETIERDGAMLAERLGFVGATVPLENVAPPAPETPLPLACRTPALEAAMRRFCPFDFALHQRAVQISDTRFLAQAKPAHSTHALAPG